MTTGRCISTCRGASVRLAVATLLAATLLAAAAAIAAAAWLPARLVTHAGAVPTVAGDGAGQAVEAWYLERPHSATVVARTSSDGGRAWGPEQALGRATEDDGEAGASIRVAVGADGTTAVVWQHLYRRYIAVMAALAGRNSRFGPAHVVSLTSGGDALDPDVAVDASGEATVVWAAAAGFMRADLTPSGRIVSRRVIPGSSGADDPTVAVDPRGDRAYAWTSNGPVCDTCVSVARESAGGKLAAAQVVSEPGGQQDADNPQIAVSRTGRTTVAWEQSDDGQGADAAAATAASGRRFGAIQFLSSTVDDGPEAILGGGAFGARGIGVDAAGHVSVVWVEVPQDLEGNASDVRVATTNASGHFAPARTLQSERGQLSYERPAIGVADGGRILVTWTVLAADSGNEPQQGVWGAASDGNRIEAPRQLSGINGDQSAVAATSYGGSGVAIFSNAQSGEGNTDDVLFTR